jgi:hypothetical protein
MISSFGLVCLGFTRSASSGFEHQFGVLSFNLLEFLWLKFEASMTIRRAAISGGRATLCTFA